MKRTRSKRIANSDSLPGRRGGKEDVRDALSLEDTAFTAEIDIVEKSHHSHHSPDVEQSGQEAAANVGSRTQFAKRKTIRNNPDLSAETLLNREKFNESLRRGLLQAATNNSPLPEWLLRRKQYDRAGESYVRLKAALVTPERRDHAKIERMLAELNLLQQRDTEQHGGAVNKAS